MKRTLFMLIGAVLFAGLAFAHGDEQHVMGTVTKITDTTITVEVAPKQDETQKTAVTVNVVPSTKFEKMGTAATMKDLKVGDRVVIHAAKKGDKLEARIVKIGMAMDGTHQGKPQHGATERPSLGISSLLCDPAERAILQQFCPRQTTARISLIRAA